MGTAFNKLTSYQHSNSVLKHRTLTESQDVMVDNPLYESEETGSEETVMTNDSSFSLEELHRPQVRKMDRSMSVVVDSVYMEAMTTRAGDYVFPFENLVFQGGGVKGYAYCGACSVLEDCGIMPNIKRFSGSSIGALYAAFFAIGYTSQELASFVVPEFISTQKTSVLGYLGLLLNLFRMLGWASCDPLYLWIGEKFAAKIGNSDITFSELYHQYGKELCVVVTNLNTMCEEYFHPKTTPDVPIRLAVKMSMTLPGYFQPTKFYHHGKENIYVDGAVLCNYPIHTFDGWWLSMKMEDRFLKRLQPLDECLKLYRHQERFGKVNPRTLGFKIYSNEEDVLDRSQLEEFTPLKSAVPIPDTILGRKYSEQVKLKKQSLEQHRHIMNAVNAFLKTLEKHNKCQHGYISREDLEKTLKDEKDFPQRYATRLFGESISVDDVFETLDSNGNGKIQMDELIYFIERTGVNIASRLFGHRWKEVDSAWSFFTQIQSALFLSAMDRSFKHQDLERSVGINTGYLNTTDFDLEDGDKKFLFQVGRNHTDAYLRHYVVTKRPHRKTSCYGSIIEEDEEEEDAAAAADDDDDEDDGDLKLKVMKSGRRFTLQ